MRVLQIYNIRKVWGGEDLYVDTITALLKKQGHEVYLWTRSNTEFENSLGGEIKVFFTGIYSPAAARAMTRMLAQYRPDVIHAHNLYPLFSPSVLAACRRAKVPVVLHCHSYLLTCPITLHFRDGKSCELCLNGREYWCLLKNCRANIFESLAYGMRSWLARKKRLFKDNVTFFIVASNFVKQQMVKGGFPESRIMVLPYPVSIPPLSRHASNGKFVGFTGRLSREKGVDILLQAAPQVPEIPICIAGDGPLMSQLVNRAPKNVTFTGWLTRAKLPDFYQQSRFMVVPSLWAEPFGIVAIEAMSHGLPVIASRTGGLTDFVEEGVTGFLFEPGDSEALAEKIRLLWDDRDLSSQMGSAARAKIINECSPEEVHYRRLMAIYQRAIESNKN